MELTLSQIEQANEMARRIGEVLKGCKSGGMDADSIEAGVFLLRDIEMKQILMHLLQTRQLHGKVVGSGGAVLMVHSCNSHNVSELSEPCWCQSEDESKRAA